MLSIPMLNISPWQCLLPLLSSISAATLEHHLFPVYVLSQTRRQVVAQHTGLAHFAVTVECLFGYHLLSSC